jgi:hypothetical protein
MLYWRSPPVWAAELCGSAVKTTKITVNRWMAARRFIDIPPSLGDRSRMALRFDECFLSKIAPIV